MGSPLPAFAQTSNCPAGSSALSVFVDGTGFISVSDSNSNVLTPYPDGVTTTINSACFTECFYMRVNSQDTTNVHVIVTLNGSVIYDETFNATGRVYVVNGATGDHDINGNPLGCDFG